MVLLTTFSLICFGITGMAQIPNEDFESLPTIWFEDSYFSKTEFDLMEISAEDFHKMLTAQPTFLTRNPLIHPNENGVFQFNCGNDTYALQESGE